MEFPVAFSTSYFKVGSFIVFTIMVYVVYAQVLVITAVFTLKNFLEQNLVPACPALPCIVVGAFLIVALQLFGKSLSDKADIVFPFPGAGGASLLPVPGGLN
jgi:hypothetical protein